MILGNNIFFTHFVAFCVGFILGQIYQIWVNKK